MARAVHRLSAKAAEKTKEPGYYCDGGGLYLQVSRTATKSWIFRFARGGKSREMGLGSARDVTLAQARAKAADARRHLTEGLDPIAVRDGERAQSRLQKAGTISFSECARKYIEAHRAGWRNAKHVGQWENTIDTYAGPVIGRLAVKDIDTALVLRVLEPIWTNKAETASRLRGRLERVLDWARVMGYRASENPARWRGHLDKLLPAAMNRKVRRHLQAMPYDEVPAFMQELAAQPGTAARALEWLILTAARTSEVIGAKPAELELRKGVWTIPGQRMKGAKEHRVPLAVRAMKIAEAQDFDGAYLFPGGKPGDPLSNMAMLMLLARMGRHGVTVHGFRSSFRDWAAECTRHDNIVVEMALAHAISDKVEAAYRRGDLFEKRRQLMDDWARYCSAPSGGKVASIKRVLTTA